MHHKKNWTIKSYNVERKKAEEMAMKVESLKKTNIQLMEDAKRGLLNGANRVLDEMRQSAIAFDVKVIFNRLCSINLLRLTRLQICELH